MAIPLRKLELIDGIDKAALEAVLWKMNERLEQLEDQYQAKTDYEVWKIFQEERHEIRKVEVAILHVLRYK